VPEPDCPVEEIDLGITGGRTAGYLYRPAGAGDEPRPLVIVMHDGSAEDAVAGAAEAERAGRIYAGRLCPLGYNVFSVTYRWSAYGREEMADVVGAFGYLSQSPYVDRDRIAAIGPGHGGYMAAFAVSSPLYERPWAAAVNLYGFVDVAEQVRAHPADTQSVLTKNVLGDPETGTDAYAEVSPSELLDSLDAPVLVVVGSEDERAGQLRSYRDEAAAGQVEYLEVQGAGYGIDYGQEPYTTQLWERVIDFLERTLEE
jgi:dipeptidyl aminopeptidase/acylaminoacyl peptidase